MRGYGYGLNGGTGGTWGIVGLILNLLFVLLIVVGVILLVWWLARQFGAGAGGRETSSKALETLKERYAKGEISKEDFDRMKKDLGG